MMPGILGDGAEDIAQMFEKAGPVPKWWCARRAPPSIWAMRSKAANKAKMSSDAAIARLSRLVVNLGGDWCVRAHVPADGVSNT